MFFAVLKPFLTETAFYAKLSRRFSDPNGLYWYDPNGPNGFNLTVLMVLILTDPNGQF